MLLFSGILRVYQQLQLDPPAVKEYNGRGIKHIQRHVDLIEEFKNSKGVVEPVLFSVHHLNLLYFSARNFRSPFLGT